MWDKKLKLWEKVAAQVREELAWEQKCAHMDGD